MYGLDLFSGIGGITKALEGYVTPVAYCENDRYAQAVLLSRMSSGDLPQAPIWDDVCTLRKSCLPRIPEIIYGGFPCQDISIAGRGAGLDGERSGLFFEIMRLADEIRPQFIFLENVTNISIRGLERVLAEIRLRGYDARGISICASEVGSPMHGHRWFLLAASVRQGLEGYGESHKIKRNVFETGKPIFGTHCSEDARRGTTWESEPSICRVVNGLPNRVERIKCLGNSVVPAQAREAFERLMGLK